MCVIIVFSPGQMIQDEHLKNAVHNNWHSWGLTTQTVITSEGFKPDLKVKRSVPKSGEVDWKEVKDALVKNKNFYRILHLRHTTAGVTNLSNCHPFEVYKSDKQRVCFMHNGTMDAYTPKKKNGNNVLVTDYDGLSDTAVYVNSILKPAFKEAIGNSNYCSTIFKKLLSGVWPVGNRGIIISNLHTPLTLGIWKDWEALGKDDKLLVSNTDYFKSVVRGPEKARREAREAEERKSKQSNKTIYHSSNGKDPAKEIIQLGKQTFDFPSSMKMALAEEYDCFSEECLKALACLHYDEWEEILQNSVKDGVFVRSETISILDIVYYLVGEYSRTLEAFDALIKKADALEKKVNEFKNKEKKVA